MRMLSDRRQKVLKALIEEYIAYAQPVGSRTLVDRYGLGVSSATVRNELSVLEEEGYLASPHTSAGRIPTDAGYRAFVDDLLAREQWDCADDAVYAQLREAASRVDDCMEQTSVALARLTDCLSVVLAPPLLNMAVKQVSLISLTPHRVLIVIVTQEGQVFNRSVEFYDEVGSDDLAAIQNTMNAMFAGRSVSDIRVSAERSAADVLSSSLARAIIDEMLICLNEAGTAKAHRLGLSSLLKKPEFSDSRAALPVLQVLEDDTVLMRLFDDVDRQGDGLAVRIGSENRSEDLSGVSVVAAQYGPTGGEGIVAVIGPTRMDYSRVIRAVRAAKDALRGI